MWPPPLFFVLSQMYPIVTITFWKGLILYQTLKFSNPFATWWRKHFILGCKDIGIRKFLLHGGGDFVFFY